MALVNPHPALKVAVPMNPMVDGWMGDDWFHNGAFRRTEYELHLRPGGHARVRRQSGGRATLTTTTFIMEAGSAGELGRRHGLEQLGFWRKTSRASQLRRLLARSGHGPRPGGPAAESAGDAGRQPVGPGRYLRRHRRSTRRIKPKDTNNDKVFLVLGPWHHGQEIGDGSSLGAITVSAAIPALYFRQEILRPFLDQYLKDGAPKADIAARYRV